MYGKIAPKDLLALSYILSGIYSCDDFRVGFAPQTIRLEIRHFDCTLFGVVQEGVGIMEVDGQGFHPWYVLFVRYPSHVQQSK